MMNPISILLDEKIDRLLATEPDGCDPLRIKTWNKQGPLTVAMLRQVSPLGLYMSTADTEIKYGKEKQSWWAKGFETVRRGKKTVTGVSRTYTEK